MSTINITAKEATTKEEQLVTQLWSLVCLFSDFDLRVTERVTENSIGSMTGVSFENGTISVHFRDKDSLIMTPSKCTENLRALSTSSLLTLARLLPALFLACDKQNSVFRDQKAESDKNMDRAINSVKEFIKLHQPKLELDKLAVEELQKIIDKGNTPVTQDVPFTPPHWPTGINPNKIYCLVADKY